MDHTAFNLQRTPCQHLPRKRSPGVCMYRLARAATFRQVLLSMLESLIRQSLISTCAVMQEYRSERLTSINYHRCMLNVLFSVRWQCWGVQHWIDIWEAWLSLVTDQQLTICSCSAMTEHVQIVSCWSVTNDNHAFLVYLRDILETIIRVDKTGRLDLSKVNLSSALFRDLSKIAGLTQSQATPLCFTQVTDNSTSKWFKLIKLSWVEEVSHLWHHRAIK